MLYYNIEPDVWFNLAHDMGVGAGCNTLDGCIHLWKWLEKVDNAFTDTHLLALLVDIHRAWVKE